MLNCRKTCMESQLIEQSQSVCWDSNHDRKHPNESGKLRLWPLACLVTLLRKNKATHVCNTIYTWRGQDYILLFLENSVFNISFSIDLLLWRLGRKETWMNWTCGIVVMLFLSLTWLEKAEFSISPFQCCVQSTLLCQKVVHLGNHLIVLAGLGLGELWGEHSRNVTPQSSEEGQVAMRKESLGARGKVALAACARAADLEGWALSSLFPGQLLSW